MKNEKIVHLYPLGTFSAFCYMFMVCLGSLTLKLLKISSRNFSAFLSRVEVTKCAKFQNPMYKGFKVGIFRISPIDLGQTYLKYQN